MPIAPPSRNQEGRGGWYVIHSGFQVTTQWHLASPDRIKGLKREMQSYLGDNVFMNLSPTQIARMHINELFTLPDDPGYQDWPLEVADADRVAEFLDAYDQKDLDNDERYALMALIMYSYDEALYLNMVIREIAERLRNALLRDFEIHSPILEYWCLFDLSPEEYENEQYRFPSTPLARSIWNEAVQP